MTRRLVLTGLIGVTGVCGGLAGCASSWDTMTSKSFKEKPFHHMFGKKDDPLTVLRVNQDGGGDVRAKAMRQLKEPLKSGGSQEDQDEVVDHILGPAATSDPSPVIRAAAIDALGRFDDPRVPKLLIAAYHQATGRSAAAPAAAPEPAVTLTGHSPERLAGQDVRAGGGGRKPGEPDRLGLAGPSGFPADVVTMLRTRSLTGLARAGSPDAVQFVGGVATGAEDDADRDVRLAAVRALGGVRQKESVVALAKVLSAEKSRDIGLASRAHEGLVSLTGKSLPAEPEKWDEVVQAGAEVAPEPTGVQRAIGLFTP